MILIRCRSLPKKWQMWWSRQREPWMWTMVWKIWNHSLPFPWIKKKLRNTDTRLHRYISLSVRRWQTARAQPRFPQTSKIIKSMCRHRNRRIRNWTISDRWHLPTQTKTEKKKRFLLRKSVRWKIRQHSAPWNGMHRHVILRYPVVWMKITMSHCLAIKFKRVWISCMCRKAIISKWPERTRQSVIPWASWFWWWYWQLSLFIWSWWYSSSHSFLRLSLCSRFRLPSPEDLLLCFWQGRKSMSLQCLDLSCWQVLL